ncbi:50S ribosomal protein L10 [Candidatus Jidaibacter acanthamoeba]|uniref:Large ribosomal subunit protein uL10 n=1 Tax=Candidatus Jidaibacter acanthamoebae TaxID=86105 RepID=A0A0C1QN55_9RICK|nr:50S ribosomal protein L10 [Candidatus Jidaibacter acanthamoeba]
MVKTVNKNREIKCQVVESMQEVFASNNIVIIMHNKGLTVSDVKDLRKKVKQAESKYIVAKNTLVRLALRESKFAELEKLMQGPTSIAYSNDPVAVSKILSDFTKVNEKLEIRGGIMDGAYLDVNAIKTLASLPSLDELRAKFLGLLNAPATKIAQILQAPGAQVARVLSAYSKK